MLVVCAIGLTAFAGTAAAQFDPPATYYQGITGTGSSLQSALRTRVSSPYTQRGYDAVRFANAAAGLEVVAHVTDGPALVLGQDVAVLRPRRN